MSDAFLKAISELKKGEVIEYRSKNRDVSDREVVLHVTGSCIVTCVQFFYDLNAITHIWKESGCGDLLKYKLTDQGLVRE